jgi:heptosyltransferase-2
VLLVRFSSIGDILLTAPALPHASIAEGLELHFLTKSPFAPIVDMLPGIHTIHTIERSVEEVVPALRALDFDVIVDWHNSLRSRQLIWGLREGRARVLRLDKHRWQRAWLVHGPSWLGAAMGGGQLPHVVERYAQAIAPLVPGGWVAGNWPALRGLPPAAQKPLPVPGAAGTRTIQLACVLGAAHPLKRIPFATWISVLTSLPGHWHFTLLGGNDDQRWRRSSGSNCRPGSRPVWWIFQAKPLSPKPHISSKQPTWSSPGTPDWGTSQPLSAPRW